MIKFIPILLVLCLAQGYAGIFDERLPSPRATAMSGSVVALPGDVWSSYYNPAALAFVGQYEAGISYQTPYNLAYLHNYFFSATGPLPGEKYGTMAISFQNFGVDFEGNDMSAEYTFGLSHGFSLMQDIHSSLGVGYSLKYYHWTLGESISGIDLGSGSAFGLDLGVQGSVYNRTYVGLYFLNINTPKIGAITKHELPQRIVAGAAYKPVDNLATTIAFDKTIGKDMQVEAGLEFYVIPMLAIRMGVSTDPNRFSAGLGFNYNNFIFDYAFRSHPVLSETHQFGLSYFLN